MVTSPKIKYFMAIPLVTTVKWLQLVTLEWYMKHPLGSQQKKTSDVSWNAFGRFTQCRHHQSGNVPRKHLPKPTTGTHPRRLQNSPYVHFVVICSFNGPQRLQGEHKTPVPHVRCFGKTSSKSHFLPSFVEAKPLPSHPRWEFLLPNKKPIPKSNKRKLHMTWVSKQESMFFKRPHFFFEF